MSIASPFSAWTMMSRSCFAACCIARKSVASSTISAPLYAMKSLRLATPYSGHLLISFITASVRSVIARWKP
jgi:hypothetical protein